jgi:hypothetical protein
VRDVDCIPELISRLYAVVHELEALFPGRRFTLDGHLVGSIGEVLAAHDYGLTLLQPSASGHDARASDGRQVQIKVTQGKRVSLSARPDHLIVLHIAADGRHREIYNGPGDLVWARVGKMGKNGQAPISLRQLGELNQQVSPEGRLPRKSEGV